MTSPGDIQKRLEATEAKLKDLRGQIAAWNSGPPQNLFDLHRQYRQLEKELNLLRDLGKLDEAQHPDALNEDLGPENNKRATPDDATRERTKRLRAFGGHSAMSLADKLYASLPSDEDRKEVNSLRGQGLDPNARLAREADLAERLTPLFENGTLAMGHNVDWDDYGELTFMGPGDHNRKKSSGMTYTPVSYENDRALGDAVKALTIRGAKSVSHLLRQMKKLQRAQDLRPKSKHLFNALVESVRALQLDSAVIGQQVLAILDANISD
ncbi:hypothetical protein PG987_011770 [Apiospora arundinis]